MNYSLGQKVGQGILAILACLFMSGCSWDTKPVQSVVVILVEQLGFNVLPCNEEHFTEQRPQFKAFQKLCQDSIRFTHAYTTSTMTQAAVASVFTGQYPYRHKVRDNGTNALAASVTTIAEQMLKQKWRTAFFSGGAPILRKGGLQQGFEIFDDNIQLKPGSYYRPASQVMSLYLNWQKTAGKNDQFAVLYLNDLLFAGQTPPSDSGEKREVNYRGQVEDLAESIATLVQALEDRKILDPTTLIIAGVNGHDEGAHDEDFTPNNLHSETTHVTLMVKPARKKRDSPISWQVDSNTTLADLGATLFDLIDTPIAPSDRALPVVSMKSVLQQAQPNWADDRIIAIESGWMRWRFNQNVLFAFRKNHDLLILGTTPVRYRTLTDNFETLPIASSVTGFESAIAATGAVVGAPSYAEPIEDLRFQGRFWRSHAPLASRKRLLETALKRNSLAARRLRALIALEQQDWSTLEKLAQLNPVENDWLFVAERGLKKNPTATHVSPCLLAISKVLGKDLEASQRDCSSEGMAELLIATDDGQSEDARTRGRERFLRKSNEDTLDFMINAKNMELNLIWDTQLKKISGPSPLDLALALPELAEFRNQTLRKVN